MSYMKRYSRDGEGKFAFILSIIFIILVIVLLGSCIYRPFNKVNNIRDVTVTVTDKDVKNSEDGSKYLIFVEDENGLPSTYEITDSWLKGRFNSSDVYAGIKVGNTYTFTVGGSRNEFLSWYPNIYEYELIEEDESQD